MGSERMVLPNKAKLRNLKQYQGMSDEEFEEAINELQEDYDVSPERLEEKIKEKQNELAKDYDLSDMKANDLAQLRSMILAMIQLDELELTAFGLRKDADDAQTIQILDKISGIQNRLIKNISDISEDLQLTRKIRKQSKEASVIDAINDLKEKARIFYKQKMLYIFCTECKMLLSTLWLNYPDSQVNNIKLKCERCNHVEEIELAPLYETDNKNLDDVVIP